MSVPSAPIGPQPTPSKIVPATSIKRLEVVLLGENERADRRDCEACGDNGTEPQAARDGWGKHRPENEADDARE
jgi:hypothetical protein